MWKTNMEMKKEESSYSKYIHKFELELSTFEDNLKICFGENDLLQIDAIRSFALEKQCVLQESIHLLEKANSILFTHYQNNLNIQIEKMQRGANKEVIMEFIRLRYIICRLEDNKSLKQLDSESREYAREIVSAGDRLAVILGVDPLK